MPERQTVTQVQQIGKETTPGTGVPATKRLGAMTINLGINSESDAFRPQGLKFATVMSQNREWTEGDIEGKPTYDEVTIPLAGAIGTPVSSSILDGATPTLAYQHVFTPSSSAADVPFTYTLEKGDAVQAEKVAGLLFTGFGLDISRSAVDLSGSVLARSVQKAITLTPALATPTDLKPILPGHFSVYLATSGANLGTTQTLQTRIISANPNIGDRYNPAWFVNAADASYGATVENAEGPTAENAITLEADAAGMAFLDKLRDGSTIFMRIEAKGEQIYNAGVQLNLTHRFTWDMALKAREVDTWSDEDGVWAIPFTFQIVHDSTWGKSQVITVVNKSATAI